MDEASVNQIERLFDEFAAGGDERQTLKSVVPMLLVFFHVKDSGLSSRLQSCSAVISALNSLSLYKKPLCLAFFSLVYLSRKLSRYIVLSHQSPTTALVWRPGQHQYYLAVDRVSKLAFCSSPPASYQQAQRYCISLTKVSGSTAATHWLPFSISRLVLYFGWVLEAALARVLNADSCIWVTRFAIQGKCTC